MGMFDSFYDKSGLEWQTKAFGRTLAHYEIGDAVPSPPLEFQVEVLGGRNPLSNARSRDGFALIRDCRLAAVPVERDERLPLLNYGGTWQTSANAHPETEPK